MGKKYVSATDSLRPGQLDNLMKGIKDSKPEGTVVKEVVSEKTIELCAKRIEAYAFSLDAKRYTGELSATSALEQAARRVRDMASGRIKEGEYGEGRAYEMVKWLNILLDYADGTKKWDTGGVWVCESHPRIPWGMGYSFDCKCGGPGMPPTQQFRGGT